MSSGARGLLHSRVRTTSATWVKWFAGAVACCAAVLLVVLNTPYLLWPYDFDPSDGDFFNFALRSLKGKSFYGDFRNGQILCLYQPLYVYWLKLLLWLDLGANTVPVARIANLAAVSGGFAVSALMLKKLMPERPEWAFLSVVVWAGSIYCIGSVALFVRPDPFMHLFLMLGYYCLVFHPQKYFVVLIFGLAAFLAKQGGASLFVSAGLVYMLQYRVLLKRVVLAGGVLVIGSLLILNYLHDGNYIHSTLIFPGTLFNTSHIRYLARYFEWYYDVNPWVLPLCLIPIYESVVANESGWIRRGRPEQPRLVIALLMETLSLAWFGRNWGGGPNYAWTQWALAIVVGFIGLERVTALLTKRMASPGGVQQALRYVAAAAALAVAVRGHWPSWQGLPHLRQSFLDADAALAQGNEYDRVIGSLIYQYPERRWLSERNTMPFVRRNVDLDIEGCTPLFFETSGTPYYARFLKRLTTGEYDFVQRSFGLNGVDRILDACYQPHTDTVAALGPGRTPIRIFLYDGKRVACKRLQAEY